MATADFLYATRSPGFTTMRLACECGEYSATKGDYFLMSHDEVFHCHQCGYDQRLEKRAYINGTTDDGHEYYGSVWVMVKGHGVTVEDLED